MLYFHQMDLQSPVSIVPFVGPRYTRALKKLEIKTIKDLIYHFPYRYQDYSLLSKINELQPGEKVTIQGQVISIKNIYTRTGKRIQTAIISDGEGKIEVTWFNQPYLVKTLPVGTQISLSGKVDKFGKKTVLVSPEYEKIINEKTALQSGRWQTKNATVHTGRLVPVYPETYGLSSKWIRSRIANILSPALQSIKDPLPEYILNKYKLIQLNKALQKIHFPQDPKEAETARKRLAFDELLEIQLHSLVRKGHWKEKKLAHKLIINRDKILRFIHNLPFMLTDSQKRAAREILQDLKKGQPMNRLLEGDVGSGKTVVAAIACFVTHTNNLQSAIMAPTQILASQHYKTLQDILSPLGAKVELLTGAHPKSKHETGADILVGTHALVQKNITFEKLGLVVIDEQHKFGVVQRALLAQKGKGAFSPHVLTMTATPIPRTVALTLYGDLDLSTLDELPKGRLKIKTWVVPPRKRKAAYNWIKQQVKNTEEQAFIVCPLIEESEKETMKTVKAAKAEFERLSQQVFPDLKLGLLHGKVKNKEKDEIMDRMKKGKIDILVATPVVEVGIDMPNATIMMIETAERFGLAQLHQLRGRVGRSDKQSYCLLFSGIPSKRALARLRSLEKTLSGRQLAEIDLEMRGPGQIYGTAQHGFPELKVASFNDVELIKATREAAEWMINKGKLEVVKLLRDSKSIAPN